MAVSVHDFFSAKGVDVRGLADFLDSLGAAARVREVRSLGAREQARLFDAVAGFRPVRLTDFVPDGTPPLREVIHYGRNSLPAFRFFEKRFCLADTLREELWGYNEQPLKAFTGPGYFVARQASESEVVIDYCEVPPRKPDSWPQILPNHARLSRFIYYRTRDFMRGVTRHVTIGRATRDGKPLENWFVLSREDAPPADQVA